jgi:hypothetical protein
MNRARQQDKPFRMLAALVAVLAVLTLTGAAIPAQAQTFKVIYVAPPGNGEISNPGGQAATPDSRIAVVDIRTGVPNLWATSIFRKAPDEQLTHFTSGMILSVAYSPDGKWLAMIRGTQQSDAVLFSALK